MKVIKSFIVYKMNALQCIIFRQKDKKENKRKIIVFIFGRSGDLNARN